MSEYQSRKELFQRIFTKLLKVSRVKLEGKVLDLCSGDKLMTIASVYNPKKVVCYEFYEKMINSLKENNISTIQANIRDPYFPFKSDSFDYSFSSGLPFRPATCTKNVLPKDIENPEEFLNKITSELIRVTKKQAIIHSMLFVKYFPKKYSDKIEIKDISNSLIVIHCQN